VAEGAAAGTFATSWSNAFSYLEIPFQTEWLEEGDQAAWDEWSQMKPKHPWRTLSQRLNR